MLNSYGNPMVPMDMRKKTLVQITDYGGGHSKLLFLLGLSSPNDELVHGLLF